MLITALVFGLLGSFHCVGMCGPIAFMLPVNRSNSAIKIIQILLYHLGRQCAYAIIGFLFGLLGKGLYLFGIQQKLSIVMGVLMILAVVLSFKQLKVNPLTKFAFQIIGRVKISLGTQLKKKRADTFFTIGFLNGFLPCGLVYMAIFGAMATGTALLGSIYMVFFGLGTIPLMTTAVYLGNFLKGQARNYIRKSIPGIVIFIGLLFVLRGLGLGIPYISPKPMSEQITNNFECHTPALNNNLTKNINND